MSIYALMPFAYAEPLPVVHNVGVIPPQWQNDGEAAYTLGEAKSHIDQAFLEVASHPNRFLIINHDLVKELWSSSEGRQELIDQHELQAFVSLNIDVEKGSAIFYARLLSPNLENYLLETTAIGAHALRRQSESEIKDLLEDLIFRLYNRIPVDVTITSIQGRFLTLSGGARQNLRPNDILEIVRPTIGTRHSANHTWLRIDSRKLGTIKVVEVKQHTAVAVIESMIHEDALQVGDGAKIADIASRSRFRQVRESDSVKLPQKPVIINPLYPKTEETVEAAPPPPPPAPPKRRRRFASDRTPTVDQSRRESPESAPVLSEHHNIEPEDTSELDGDSGGLYDRLAMLFDYGQVHAGMRMWKYRGAANAAASFPMIFVNNLAATAGRQLSDELYVEGHAQLNFGGTKLGSFAGFDVNGRMFMVRPLSGTINWQLGGFGGLFSLAIEEETFGGGDILYGGGFVGADGPLSFADIDLRWHGEFGVTPVNIGQLGIQGTMRDIKSSLGYHMRAGATLPNELPESWEWGAQMEMAGQTYYLDSNRTLKVSAFNLRVSATYKF